MEEKARKVNKGSDAIGCSLGGSGYRLGKTGSGSAYSAVATKGYASLGTKGYGNFLFKNKGALAHGLYAAMNPVLHYARIIDVVEEELKRYRKKLYDLVGMANNSHYRFN